MIHKKRLNIPNNDELEISLFGPGYGECIVIHLAGGKWVIIDSCIDSKTGEPSGLEYLKALNVDVTNDVILLQCTHWHDDHIRGFYKLTEACTNATVCCSAALKESEFINLIAAYSEDTMMDNPGTKEIFKCFESLSKKDKIPHWSIQDRIILKEEIKITQDWTLPVKIASLSPSDHSILASKLAFKSMQPKIYEPKRGLKTSSPNLSSTVTYIEIGELAILLGADLEVTSNHNSGWDCILNSSQTSMKKALFYKVSHHGSHTGHHPSIWSDLLHAEPLSLLTPFRKGRIAIPNNSDINRLKQLPGEKYITSSKDSTGKVKRSRTVERTIGEATRSTTIYQMKSGHIRVRYDLRDSKGWDIELSDDASQII